MYAFPTTMPRMVVVPAFFAIKCPVLSIMPIFSLSTLHAGVTVTVLLRLSVPLALIGISKPFKIVRVSSIEGFIDTKLPFVILLFTTFFIILFIIRFFKLFTFLIKIIISLFLLNN